MSTRPSVMGPMRSSPPCDRHAAELTLLSVVDAKAATLCLLEGAVNLSRYACSSCDDHWPCNGFTASTVPATSLGISPVGSRSATPITGSIFKHSHYNALERFRMIYMHGSFLYSARAATIACEN